MAERESVLNGFGFVATPPGIESTQHLCDPCKFTGRKLKAKGYCKNCDGHLCQDCLKVHRTSRDTREHKVISEAKYSTSAFKNNNGILRCEEHQATLETYCDDHDLLCCHLCISNAHRTCKVLVPIQRAASGIKDGSSIADLTTDLDKMLTQFMRLKSEGETEAKNISKQGQSVTEHVKEIRKEVNKILDKAEQALLKKKDEICKCESQEVFERYKACESAIPVLQTAKDRLEKLRQDKSEQNSFIIAKKVEKVIQQFKPVLEGLGDQRNPFSVKYEPNKDLITAMYSLGSIITRATEHFVCVESNIPKDVSYAASIRKLEQSGEINVKSNSDTAICTITGCAFLSDNNTLVIVDETNKTLKVIGDENNVSQTFILNVTPWDVVALTGNTVAIRSSFSDKDENSALVLSVDKDIKHVTDFKIGGRLRAIAYDEPNIYVAYTINKTSQISILDENFKEIKKIRPVHGVLKQPQYMEIDKSTGRLYISDFYKGVIVLDFNGELIAELNDTNLTEYGGITKDTNGDIYLCAGKPYGVYKLSKDCRSVTALVVWGDGKIDPQTVAYNFANDSFIVTSCNSNRAFLFSYIDKIEKEK